MCTAASFLLFLLLDTDCALIVDTIVKFIVVIAVRSKSPKIRIQTQTTRAV